MYKNILIPLAYQPGHHADAEVRAAQAISAPGARITLVHVIGAGPGFSSDHTEDSSEMAHVIEHDLERIARNFVEAEVKVLKGEPEEVILDLAKSDGVDCIVLAPHRTDTGEYGSVASQVVRRAPCTVHLVR